MIHDKLPIHKTGSDLLGLATRMQAQMRREYKRVVGDKIVDHCAAMLDMMALANAAKGDRRRRMAHIEDVLAHQRAVTVWMRVALDLKIVSQGPWADATQLIQSIGRQAGGWKNRTNDEAPAA